MWVDEFTSLEISSKALKDIISGTGFDSHTPPMYYVLLHFWNRLLGANELSIRLFSVLFDAINVVLLAKVTSRLVKDVRVTYGACFLYAMSPYAIYYAQDGRMYTLLVTLCLLTTLAVSRFPFTGILSNIGFVLLCTVGMYTHYYYALFLASISAGIFLFGKLSNKEKRHYVLLAILIALAFIPWLHVIRTLLAGKGQEFREFVWTVLPYAFFRFSAGYGIMVLNTTLKANFTETLSSHMLYLVPYFGVFASAVVIGFSQLVKESRRCLLIVSFALLGPALLALFISFFTPMLSERYLIVSYPFFCLLIALLLRTPRGSILYILCSVLSLYGLFQHLYNPNLKNTEWRGASKTIEQSPAACTNVVVNPPHLEGLVDYYLPAQWSVLDKSVSSSSDCTWLIERGTADSWLSEFTERGFSPKYERYFPYENEIRLVYLVKEVS